MSSLTYEKIREAMALIPPQLPELVEPPTLIVCHVDHLDEVKAAFNEKGIEVRGTKYVDPDMVYIIKR